MNFVALDFETANEYRDSACQVGLTFVEDNKIIKTETYLINPNTFFNNINSHIHGIKDDHVKSAPFFEDIWNTLFNKINNQTLVAHNAIFDIGVLRSSIESRGLHHPNCDTYCTYQISKIAYPNLPSYSLPFMAQKIGLSFEHHNAGEDSRVCAELFLNFCKEFEVNSIEDVSERFSIIKGNTSAVNFSNPLKKRVYANRSVVTKEIDAVENPDSPFYNKSVVITGTLSSMERKKAHQFIVNLGGKVSEKVGKKTDYLIIGQVDFRQVGDKGASRKQIEAETLSNQGYPIEIVDENFFLQCI